MAASPQKPAPKEGACWYTRFIIWRPQREAPQLGSISLHHRYRYGTVNLLDLLHVDSFIVSYGGSTTGGESSLPSQKGQRMSVGLGTAGAGAAKPLTLVTLRGLDLL